MGAENGRPRKPWDGEQYGIAQNLCRGRSVSGGKWGLQKIFGTGGKKEDRILLLQGQDFWGMEEGEEVICEVSHKSPWGVYQTCKDSRVLLGVHITEATESRLGLEPTAEHKPKLQCCLHSYLTLLPEDWREWAYSFYFQLTNPWFGNRNILKWLSAIPFSYTSVAHWHQSHSDFSNPEYSLCFTWASATKNSIVGIEPN